jgi:poly(3-hydroxybutyrate) depolymerase
MALQPPTSSRVHYGVAIALLSGCSFIDRTPPEDAIFSEGCGTAFDEVGALPRELGVEGALRSFRLRPPGSYDRDFPFPLVIALHGAGDTGDAIREYSEIESVSRATAVYLYPDALAADDGIPRWNPSVGGPDHRFLDAMVDDVAGELCVDRSRVFVFGFSSGASMANAWACASDYPRAFAAHAGGPPPASCLGPRHAWIGHDRKDPVVDVIYGEQAREAWLDENQCSDQSEPFSPGPCQRFDCAEAPVIWCEDDSSSLSAHSWPSWVSESLWAFFETI